MATCSPRPYTLDPVLCLFDWPASWKPLAGGLLFLFCSVFPLTSRFLASQVCLASCSDKTRHSLMRKLVLGIHWICPAHFKAFNSIWILWGFIGSTSLMLSFYWSHEDTEAPKGIWLSPRCTDSLQQEHSWRPCSPEAPSTPYSQPGAQAFHKSEICKTRIIESLAGAWKKWGY